MFQGQSRNPLLDRFHENEDGGDDDHRTLESSGEKRDAFVSVKKGGSRGFRAQAKAERGESHCDHMHDRLSEIRQNRGRPGHVICDGLSHQHNHADGQGHAHSQAGGAQFLLIAQRVHRSWQRGWDAF